MDNELQTDLHSDIMTALRGLEYDVTQRNNYMKTRYDAIYADGLYRTQDIDGWFAEYNLVSRVVDIFTSQLFGREFSMVSDYSKEDLSVYEGDPNQQQLMQFKNRKLKADADMRMKAARSIIADNGGMTRFEDGGRIGSSMGETVYKLYPDVKAKKVVISLLESPQNYRAGWSDDDFRERDFDAYVMQISVDKANRAYKSKIPAEATFFTSQPGNPLLDYVGSANPLDSNANGIPSLRTGTNVAQTTRKMVTTVDFVGYLPGWGTKNGKIVKVESGNESRICVYDVGGYIVDEITDEKLIPRYYPIPNRKIPRQAWGASDISDSLIDINKEIIRIMADEMAWADKNLWKILLGKGFTEEQLSKLKNKKRKTKLLAAGLEQSIEEVGTSSQPLSEFEKLINQRLDLFVRIAGVGRVLFDDPTINANSNQALMTTLKGVVDIITTKQKVWEAALVEMFTDAMYMAASFIPELKEVLADDPNWSFRVEWPSVFHREDQTFQTGLINRLNAKSISLETFLQKADGGDSSEELDRIRDNYKDPVTAAIMGGVTAELAQQVVTPAPQGPPPPDVKYNVSVKADATADPVANADLIRVVDPQLPDTGAPSGAEQGVSLSPDQLANPQLTTDQNTGQSASQPGSGAPAVSSEGAVAQAAQNRGA